MNRYPSDTYAIVRAVIERGNSPGLIREWFDVMNHWANSNPSTDAAALRLWLPSFPLRPFYTAEELAKFWPGLKLSMGLTEEMTETPSANRLQNELEFCGLPVLQHVNGPPNWFFDARRNQHKYFIVEHCHKWRDARLSQEEFENVLNG